MTTTPKKPPTFPSFPRASARLLEAATNLYNCSHTTPRRLVHVRYTVGDARKHVQALRMTNTIDSKTAIQIPGVRVVTSDVSSSRRRWKEKHVTASYEVEDARAFADLIAYFGAAAEYPKHPHSCTLYLHWECNWRDANGRAVIELQNGPPRVGTTASVVETLWDEYTAWVDVPANQDALLSVQSNRLVAIDRKISPEKVRTAIESMRYRLGGATPTQIRRIGAYLLKHAAYLSTVLDDVEQWPDVPEPTQEELDAHREEYDQARNE